MYALHVGWPTYRRVRTRSTFIVPQLTKQLHQNTTLCRILDGGEGENPR